MTFRASAWDIVTWQGPNPVQSPLQPAKLEPDAAVAVRVTTVPVVKLAAQVEPQLIPAGLEVTVPKPVPVRETFKVPKFWKFVDNFPLTVTGKVQKNLMREASVAELNLSAAAGVETA